MATATRSDNNAGHSALDTMGERVQHVLDEAQERIGDAGSKVSELSTRARDGAQHSLEVVEKVIKRHPIATVAVGLGLGYLLGRLMARG